jgi:uncharacterized membrane protein YjgN (DUF898 family)
MAQDWYYISNGNRLGPIPAPKLKELATSGQLQPTDMIWREGLAQWVAASSLKGLFAGGVAAAPRAEAPVLLDSPEYDNSKARPARRPGEGFEFDGGAGSFFVTGLLIYLLTAVTLGIGYPWAYCMYQRWKAEHTLISGKRLRFVGTGGDLFVLGLKMGLLYIVTAGIYSFWMVPRMNRWIAENTEFARE